jgi:Fic/DOC family
MPSSAPSRQQPAEVFFAGADAALARQLQRRAKAGELLRIGPGVYTLAGTDEEVRSRVRRHWQLLAGHLVPQAVVSHISALTRGLTEGGYVTLSHPTRFNRTIKLPGVELVLLKGEPPQPGDLPLGNTGLYWASRHRALLENLGRVTAQRPTRAGRQAVEERLVSILNASGEDTLNQVRDAARALAPAMAMDKAFDELNRTVGLLLKTRQQGQLRTKLGQLVAQGTPVDAERLARFELLATALRTAVLPTIADVAPDGDARVHFAFIESYFSNYVEGTKFSIEEAEGIVLRNTIVVGRPKDSHDVLGVFHQALRAGTRDSVPAPGAAFVAGLQERHRAMLERRPEANPGELKTQSNFAGTTQFVQPAFVRGTLQEGSKLALSVPEGLARAIYYAFLVSETHPFDDGNGRLSRLTMNAELTRLGLCRIIIPTLFHPQYVDCQRALTRSNEVDGFIKALAFAARWCARLHYGDLPALIASLRATNAFEESPTQFKLLDAPSAADG